MYITSTMDCFIVPLHSATGKQLPVLRAVQRTVSGLWKTVQIPTIHRMTDHTMQCSLCRIHCSWITPHLRLIQALTQGVTPAMSPNRLSVPQPPRLDCETVYYTRKQVCPQYIWYDPSVQNSYIAHCQYLISAMHIYGANNIMVS